MSTIVDLWRDIEASFEREVAANAAAGMPLAAAVAAAELVISIRVQKLCRMNEDSIMHGDPALSRGGLL